MKGTFVILLYVLVAVIVVLFALRKKNKGLTSNPVNDGPDCPDCRRECDCSNGRCICGTKCMCQ